MTYSTDKNIAANLETITAAHAHEVIEMNRRGEKPLTLQMESSKPAPTRQSIDLTDGDISRFDKAKKKKKKKDKRREGARKEGGRSQENNHEEQ